MHDTRMSGVTWTEAETGLTTEWSIEEEEEGEEENQVQKKKRKATSDADRKLGFGPYTEFTY